MGPQKSSPAYVRTRKKTFELIWNSNRRLKDKSNQDLFGKVVVVVVVVDIDDDVVVVVTTAVSDSAAFCFKMIISII